MSLLALLAARRTTPDPTPPVGADLPSVEETPIPYAMPTTAPWNAPAPAIIPTYDGSDAPTHPSVVDMVQETGKPWRGYRFWMCHTPYPKSDSSKENPSIVVSNNGYHWHDTAVGITNPIVPQPGNAYNSDGDILWNPEKGRMEMVYRPMDVGERIKGLHTYDGRNWSEPVQLLPSPVGAGRSGGLVSPSLIRVSATEWRMYVRTNASAIPNAPGIAYYSASSPEGPWDGPAQCSVGGVMPNDSTTSEYLWHLKVIRVGAVYYAFAATYTSTNLYPGISRDGTNFTFGPAAIQRRPGQWDSGWLYRPTMVPHENGKDMRVWYAAHSSDKIGYTILPRSLWDTL